MNQNQIRRAVIKGMQPHAKNLDIVNSYMPKHYHAYIELGEIVIIGHDYAGWTLDKYVIPRLASGLIVAVEDNESHNCHECGTTFFSNEPMLWGENKVCDYCFKHRTRKN